MILEICKFLQTIYNITTTDPNWDVAMFFKEQHIIRQRFFIEASQPTQKYVRKRWTPFTIPLDPETSGIR